MATGMTEKRLRQLCEQYKLFRTPELNDKLYLQYKGFERIESCISVYTGVRQLWLEGNGLETIENLEKLTELRELYLHENLLEDISGLEALQELATLNLSDNRIPRLRGLPPLPRLNALYLAGNKLQTAEDLAELEQLPNLMILDLSKNLIEDVAAIDLLARLPKLAALKLEGNGVCGRVEHYRKRLIVRLRGLKHLDDRPVFDDERRCAEAWARGGPEAEREERQRIRLEERERTLAGFAEIDRLGREARARKEQEEREAAERQQAEEERRAEEEARARREAEEREAAAEAERAGREAAEAAEAAGEEGAGTGEEATGAEALEEGLEVENLEDWAGPGAPDSGDEEGEEEEGPGGLGPRSSFQRSESSQSDALAGPAAPPPQPRRAFASQRWRALWQLATADLHPFPEEAVGGASDEEEAAAEAEAARESPRGPARRSAWGEVHDAGDEEDSPNDSDSAASGHPEAGPAEPAGSAGPDDGDDEADEEAAVEAAAEPLFVHAQRAGTRAAATDADRIGALELDDGISYQRMDELD
eukprot:tig00000865_g5107.t1